MVLEFGEPFVAFAESFAFDLDSFSSPESLKSYNMKKKIKTIKRIHNKCVSKQNEDCKNLT